MEWQNITEFILALVGGGLFGFLTYLFGRKQANAKTAAETKKIEADIRSTDASTIDMMQKTIGDLTTRLDQLYNLRDEDQKRIDDLEAEIRELKRERDETDEEVARLRRIVRYFRSGVKRLIEQLKEHDIEPAWTPDDSEEDK